LALLCAAGCGGSPNGPSASTTATITFDGQTVQGRPDGSKAFSRRPTLDWVDVTITRCSGTEPSIAITLKGVANPVAAGTYTIRTDADVLSANANISGQQWSASNFVMAQYCGGAFGGGVLPPCTPDSPGTGSVTISSASTSRIAGSYRVVGVLPTNFSGNPSQRPPPVTKVIEGVFDLAFDSSPSCGG
jgi:hypothetical protein